MALPGPTRSTSCHVVPTRAPCRPGKSKWPLARWLQSGEAHPGGVAAHTHGCAGTSPGWGPRESKRLARRFVASARPGVPEVPGHCKQIRGGLDSTLHGPSASPPALSLPRRRESRRSRRRCRQIGLNARAPVVVRSSQAWCWRGAAQPAAFTRMTKWKDDYPGFIWPKRFDSPGRQCNAGADAAAGQRFCGDGEGRLRVAPPRCAVPCHTSLLAGSDEHGNRLVSSPERWLPSGRRHATAAGGQSRSVGQAGRRMAANHLAACRALQVLNRSTPAVTLWRCGCPCPVPCIPGSMQDPRTACRTGPFSVGTGLP